MLLNGLRQHLNLDINPMTVGRLLKRNDIKECENVSNTTRSRAVQYPDMGHTVSNSCHININ